MKAFIDAIAAYLQAKDITATVSFGRREAAKQVNQGPGRANRVVFAPGANDNDGASLGGYDAPVHPRLEKAAPRALWDMTLVLRVYVWAYDPAAPENELAQWDAWEDLHDAVIEAIHAQAAGFYKLSSPTQKGTAERRFGQENYFLLELRRRVLAQAKTYTPGAATGSGATYLGETGSEAGC